MARNFKELRDKMSPERRARNDARVKAYLAVLRLAELREHVGVTQEEMAGRLSVAQSSISRMERRDDMLVSTLRDAIAALGGELRLTAEFPEGMVELDPSGRQG